MCIAESEYNDKTLSIRDGERVYTVSTEGIQTETDAMTRPRHITLIELLGVMFVAAILAAIILTAAKVVTQQSKRAAVRSTLKRIELALEQYKEDWGCYPQTGGEGVAITKSFVYGSAEAAGLQQPRESAGAYGKAWGHYYVDPKNLMYKRLRSKVWHEEDDNNENQAETYYPGSSHQVTVFCVDKWDKPYWYQCPGSMNEESYDLWSTGADQFHGAADKNEDSPGDISTGDHNNGLTYPVHDAGLGPPRGAAMPFAQRRYYEGRNAPSWLPAFEEGLQPHEDVDPGDHATTEVNDDITNWRRN